MWKCVIVLPALARVLVRVSPTCYGVGLAVAVAVGGCRLETKAEAAQASGSQWSWQRWSDSTCRAFARSLPAAIRRAPDLLRPPFWDSSEVGFSAGFGNYYHPEGPLGAGLLLSGVKGVEGMVPMWPCGVFVPLYERPDERGPPSAWLIGGRLVRADRKWGAPLNQLPVIRVGQSENALLVYEIRRDGWARVRYYWPSNDGNGTAWVHASQLSLGPVPLSLVTWEEFLVNRSWPLLVFRDRGGQRIYAEADTTSRVIDRPAGDYGLRALETRGDWMRVHMQRTSAACIDSRKVEPADTGWVVWRSRERGLLLWVEAWDC